MPTGTNLLTKKKSTRGLSRESGKNRFCERIDVADHWCRYGIEDDQFFLEFDGHKFLVYDLTSGTFNLSNRCGEASVTSGLNTIEFSYPLDTKNYQVFFQDMQGVGIVEIVERELSYFTIRCIDSGTISYNAVINS